MGRSKQRPKHKLSIYIPEEEFQEMILLSPELQDGDGNLRHGALSDLVSSMIRIYNQQKREQIKRQL